MNFMYKINGFVHKNMMRYDSQSDIRNLTSYYFSNESKIEGFLNWPGEQCCKDEFLKRYAFLKCKINKKIVSEFVSKPVTKLRSSVRNSRTKR